MLIKKYLDSARRPKKQLGQHFLTNPAYIAKIADTAQIARDTPVIEIGPGAASLTEELLRRTERLKVIEFDRDAARFIEENFPNLDIIASDVLKTDLSAIFGEKAVIVGNLPYNISVKILEHCTNHIAAFSRLVFMFQSEAADRIIANAGSKTYSSLSVYAAYYYAVRRICRIGGGNFFPKTRVSSSVLEFVPHPSRLLPSGQESGFFAFVRDCFKQKRKTLKNNVAYAAANFKALSLPDNIRAEQLTLSDFAKLYLMTAYQTKL
ncbi:MAG: 16S rRNA (adenine(1518)-N(6)/adenine(1519)-N(6))-dimethyltransferase RsmA [Deferribacteraceae bacterium]|nr:16S rRNA (adenine(1518)-N(6)/adenine(1519)-N(6))-dimethyltransferase RsmA [Deferribacteraceae bacterium]